MLNSKLRVLIDTNVIIHSEDNKEMSNEVQIFHKNSRHYEVTIHPAIKNDLQRDNDLERKKIVLSKLGKYNELDFNADPDNDFYKKIPLSERHNDLIDNKLLFSVYCGLCDYLVTEDRGIHKKSYALGIKDKVFSLIKFNQYIDSLFTKETQFLVSFKNIIHDKISKVCPRPIDEIFDSLKSDYSPNFENWYKKIIREERRGFFIVGNEKSIYGLCLYDDSNIEYSDGIKVSTFKISSKKKGSKEGEKLLRQIIVYAMKSHKKYLYVEVKKGNDFINWLESFGFYNIGDKKGDSSSIVMKKDIFSSEDDRGIIYNYPFYYIGHQTNLFLIPIQSIYSEKLFPEIHSQLQIQLDDNVCGNTIKKSYLSGKNNTKIKKGDLIFFYETSTGKGNKENNMRLISFGVVEETLYTDNNIDAIKFIGKRSVYTAVEITHKASSGIFIINFRYLDELNIKPTYDDLCSNGVLNGPPQSIQSIDRNNYNYLYSLLGSYYR